MNKCFLFISSQHDFGLHGPSLGDCVTTATFIFIGKHKQDAALQDVLE
jgi:hypothetical protein